MQALSLKALIDDRVAKGTFSLLSPMFGLMS